MWEKVVNRWRFKGIIKRIHKLRKSIIIVIKMKGLFGIEEKKKREK